MRRLKRAHINSNGSAMLVALAAVVVLSAAAVVGMKLSGSLRSQSQALQPKLNSVKFGNYLSTLLGDANICKGVPGSAFTGLAFYPAQQSSSGPAHYSSESTASQNLFVPNAMQPIRLGTALASGAIQANTSVAEFNLKVNKFYIQSAGSGSSYSGDVFMSTSDLTTGQSSAMQKIGSVRLQVTSSGGTRTLIACQSTVQAADVCSNMGCTWQPNLSPKCLCHLPPLDCSDTPYGYVEGVTMTNGNAQKICKSADFTCPSGQFFQGFDSQGGMRCAAAHLAVAAAATPKPTATPSDCDWVVDFFKPLTTGGTTKACRYQIGGSSFQGGMTATCDPSSPQAIYCNAAAENGVAVCESDGNMWHFTCRCNFGAGDFGCH